MNKPTKTQTLTQFAKEKAAEKWSAYADYKAASRLTNDEKERDELVTLAVIEADEAARWESLA